MTDVELPIGICNYKNGMPERFTDLKVDKNKVRDAMLNRIFLFKNSK